MISNSLLRSVAAAGALLLVLGACGKDEPKIAANGPESSSTAGQPAAAGPPPEGSTDKVEVKDFAFTPKSITVKSGTTVTWTFSDTAAHSVDPVGGTEPKKSADLKSGASYTFTFAKPGTFNYRCGIHNSMTGTVVVTA